MEEINDGGPAFPGKMGYRRAEAAAQGGVGGWPSDCRYTNEGLSLRDFFAAAALTGLMADSTCEGDPVKSATYCFKVADAMISARNGQGG